MDITFVYLLKKTSFQWRGMQTLVLFLYRYRVCGLSSRLSALQSTIHSACRSVGRRVLEILF